MKKFAAILLGLLVATYALADNPSLNEQVLQGGGGKIIKTGTLCSGQTSASTGCTGSVGGRTDELVADLTGFSSVVFYSNQSTSPNYVCDIYSSDTGYDTDSGVGIDRSDQSLSNLQEMIVLDGALFKVWAECSTLDTTGSTSVTITYRAIQ